MTCRICEAVTAEEAKESLAALCRYQSVQLDRLNAENLRLRTEQADGPRLRVNELEQIVARLNDRITNMNRAKR